MKIEFSKQALKDILGMDKPTKTRIKQGVEGLTENPPKGDIKQLQNYRPLTYRLRIGKYRIIFRFIEDENKEILIYVLEIGSRGDIYK